MSFLDSLTAPFSTAAQTNAANAQIGQPGSLFGGGSGILGGLSQALPNYQQGITSLSQNYSAGLQPFLQNYQQAQPGIQQLGNVLGLNGPAGNAQAMQALQSTPGYQFSLQQGQNVGKANAAQQGLTGSGNEALALQQQAQGTAQQAYGQYVNQLLPYLNQANQAATGQGLLYSGLGNQLNSAYQNTGNLQYGAGASIGNANANAALAPLTAGANILGLGTGILGGLAGSSGAQSALSNIGKGLGSGLSGLFGLSDRRAKDDVEEIGKLNDGQKVYRFRYKGDSRPQIGLMAQEVEKRHPEAVAEIDGVKFVDYGRATNRSAQLQAFMG